MVKTAINVTEVYLKDSKIPPLTKNKGDIQNRGK